MTPKIYTLERDYARWGLTRDERDYLLTRRFFNRDGGAPDFIVCHIQDGWTGGSLGYWAGREGGDVQASATVMIQRDGSILQVIREEHGPWTNGDVQSPKPAADELLARGGNPNNWCLTIEAEGVPFTPLPDAEFDAVLWQIRDWQHRYDISDSHVLTHSDINSVTRANCADGYYLTIRDAMRSHPDGHVYAIPYRPEWWSPTALQDGKDRVVNGTIWHYVKRPYVVTQRTKRLSLGDKDSPQTGPPLEVGESFVGVYVFRSHSDQHQYVVSEWGSRIYARHLSPYVQVAE